MKVIDLLDEHKSLYFICLEDWSSEMEDAGNHKEQWYNAMNEHGLRVKLALDDDGNIGGMIQYLPIEFSFAEGKDLYFINCIWVHGYKHGRGNFQKQGYGKSLIQAAEEDAKTLGAKGIVAWGMSLPFWMKASWFKKQGYEKVDKESIRMLLWKPFTNDAVPPKWIRQKKTPRPTSGKVSVVSFMNGWCPAQNMVFERAKKAASEFGEKVEFKAFHTRDRDVFLEWGIVDGLFINGKQIRTGPPPSYEKIKKKIAKQVNKL